MSEYNVEGELGNCKGCGGRHVKMIMDWKPEPICTNCRHRVVRADYWAADSAGIRQDMINSGIPMIANPTDFVTLMTQGPKGEEL